MPDIIGIKRAPISRAPTSFETEKWRECLRLADELADKVFVIDLLSECLIVRAGFAASRGVSLPLVGAELAEQRYLLLKKANDDLQSAFDRVRSLEYGLKWRNNDFDIVESSQSLGVLFIPVILGAAVILAGCFVTLYHLGKESDLIRENYKKLNAAAEATLCKDPDSELCKNWNSVKKEQKIEEKESFVDSLKGSISKGLMIAVALFAGMVALSMWKGVK